MAPVRTVLASRRTRAALLALTLSAAALAVTPSGAAPALVRALPDHDGAIARAALASLPQGEWLGLDGHVHTDHSHDAGFFHQQQETPESHDTDVASQIQQAELMGEDFITLTDHRTYDQAYDPTYVSTRATLIDGEEWGGYPHATAWGISETLEQGPDEGVCGVARAAREVRAQDGVFGVAHPEDGRKACISVESLRGVPIDHLESFRAPHTKFWTSNIAAGNRLVPVTGSDNHFRQVYGTEGGTGGNSTFVYATAATQAGLVEAVRKGRVQSTTRVVEPKLTTLLDADRDGQYEVMTGGSSVPSGDRVRVAFAIDAGVRYWLQVYDERDLLLAQEQITTPGQVLAFELPASAKLYRGQLAAQPTDRISAGEVLGQIHGFGETVGSYVDTLRVVSAPVYLSEPEPVEDGTQDTILGSPTELSGDVPFAGFADVARHGNVVVAAWQERRGHRYDVMMSWSRDGGATWDEPRFVSLGLHDARTPSVALDGSWAAVAYENHQPETHGGDIHVVRYPVEGEYITGIGPSPAVNARNVRGARPTVAVSGGRIHLAWMSMEDGYKIRYTSRPAAYTGNWQPSRLLSSATTWEGGIRLYAVPPAPIRHVPAAVHPVIAADAGHVAIAWEDNREDTTPLRNGTPDDWAIYGAFSSDGGQTWTADSRLSPRIDARAPSASDPERHVGNPARHPDLLFHGDRLFLAYQHSWAPSAPGGSGANVYVRSTDELGSTWTDPLLVSYVTGELSYKPQLSTGASGLEVFWQASQGAVWKLRRAVSIDGGTTFGPQSDFTTGTGYAGYPAAASGVVVWTGEEHGTYKVFARAH